RIGSFAFRLRGISTVSTGASTHWYDSGNPLLLNAPRHRQRSLIGDVQIHLQLSTATAPSSSRQKIDGEQPLSERDARSLQARADRAGKWLAAAAAFPDTR